MAIAALEVSVVALPVAATSAGYTRMQARAAAALSDIEDQRHRQEASADLELRSRDVLLLLVGDEPPVTSLTLFLENPGVHYERGVAITPVDTTDRARWAGEETWEVDDRLAPGEEVQLNLSQCGARSLFLLVRRTDGRQAQRRVAPLRGVVGGVESVIESAFQASAPAAGDFSDSRARSRYTHRLDDDEAGY